MLSVTEAKTGLEQEAAGAAEPLAALAAHDPDAWQSLFERYYDKMYRFAYVRTGDASAAEEIAAEVFVAAASGIGRYKDTGAPFASWLYRVARNLTADHLDRRRRRPVVALDAVEISVGAWDGAVDDAADIARALAGLTKDQQEVLLLRFFSDCSLEETAGAMGKKVGAIKVLQHRALAAMKRQLTLGGRT
jgi:RNA polymerase sigma-70 factor (ECF subfamily)